MKPRAKTMFAVLLRAGFTGCSGPRHLETSLGGRPLEDMLASATKAGDRWQCELQLPLGVWRVETREAQDVEMNYPHQTETAWKGFRVSTPPPCPEAGGRLHAARIPRACPLGRHST